MKTLLLLFTLCLSLLATTRQVSFSPVVDTNQHHGFSVTINENAPLPFDVDIYKVIMVFRTPEGQTEIRSQFVPIYRNPAWVSPMGYSIFWLPEAGCTVKSITARPLIYKNEFALVDQP